MRRTEEGFAKGAAIALREGFDGAGLRRLAKATNYGLSDRVFVSYDDIVAPGCEAWNYLIG